jgi:hypothetical protein
MPDVDIFNLWRYMLSTVVTIYVLIYTARTIWSHVLWFSSSRRYKVMGHYALVLLLRARIRRFAGELVWISALALILAGVVGLHWVLVV